MIEPDKFITKTPSLKENEYQHDLSWRPKKFNEYLGQDAIKDQLNVFVQAAKNRKEALDHVLLYGPPGLGKTTLALVIANEMGVNLRQTSGPIIEKTGDLAALLTHLSPKDVLFIDEIHRLSPTVEEILYPALEDYHLDIMIGEGPSARTVKINLPPFTLIGATTRAGMLTNPLRDRFGILLRLNFYSPLEISLIVSRSASLMGLTIEIEAAQEIAERSRGTPRIANRLLRRVRDFSDLEGSSIIKKKHVEKALSVLKIDAKGLDENDHRVLTAIIDHFDGGPVGLDALSATLSEEKETIEDIIEPFLIQKGFLQRTPRGRIVTQMTYEYLQVMPSRK